MKYQLTIIVTAIAAVWSVHSGAAEIKARINKCQDAQGHWHYGDTAAAACAQTKIEVMDQRGLRVREVAAPPTAAELKARQAELEASEQARLKAAEQAKRDKQLLATYGHEDDIALGRDRRLADIKAQISTIESTLETLRATLKRMQAQPGAAANIAKTEAQIAKQEASLAERVREQELIKTRYTEELRHYRELKGAAPAKTVTAPTPAPAK